MSERTSRLRNLSKMFVIFRLSSVCSNASNGSTILRKLPQVFLRTVTDSLEMSSTEKLISLNFEVFGRVQGVFFRKFTEQQATQLGLRGWCMNTRNDTVKGIMEGPPSKVAEMKVWLEKTGSPKSRIDRAVFTDEKNISKYTYDSFKIKR